MAQGLPPVPWRACILVFVVALVFRLAWVVATDQIHEFPRKEMVKIAMTFAERGELADPYAVPTGPTAVVPPVYPIFLGLIFRIFGTGVAAEVVKCVLTSTVSALRCALIPWLAVWLGLSLRTGMIGGLMSAFYLGALATDIKGDWAEAYAATALVGLFLAASASTESARLSLRSAAMLGFWWGLTLLLSPESGSPSWEASSWWALSVSSVSRPGSMCVCSRTGVGGRPGDFALADSQRHPSGKPHMGEGQLRHHAG